ncbi:hypothetical protein KOI35_15845 [Actinoplanes bogorensis]|uniref:Uncharacterized protein n=1 Tax=Paractinoplanes bogorensis TaxID=1610840 RepID=A0ABS5YND5_9ACTN|nr:hypothetical protein [Actinoplanes bogorensis]MBU2664976.1 hypothetical protein [Actinoplanes bogorensis]
MRRSVWLVGGPAVLVLLSSFLPWWSITKRSWVTETVTAWQASTRWTVAIALCLVAALVWLGARRFRNPVPTALWLTTLAMVGFSIYLTLDQRADVSHKPLPSQVGAPTMELVMPNGLTTIAFADLRDVRITRDDLREYNIGEVVTGPARGYHAGLTAMILLGLSLIVVEFRRPPTPPTGPPPTGPPPTGPPSAGPSSSGPPPSSGSPEA